MDEGTIRPHHFMAMHDANVLRPETGKYRHGLDEAILFNVKL